MKSKVLFAAFVSALMILPAGAVANGSHGPQFQLPSPGTTPDSPVYGLDRAAESISLAFSFSPSAKAEKRLQLAEERLAEAEEMARLERPDLAERMANDYEKEVSEANRAASEAEGDDKEEVSERVSNATSKHIAVLDRVKERVPERAKSAIETAQQKSITGNQEALRALARENSSKAAEIAMDVAAGRARAAEHAADNNETEEVSDAAEEYSSYANFGEEISSIAQQTGQNQTKVQELVSKATSIHLKVLTDVLERVPQQAKDSIRNAMENARKGMEMAPEAAGRRGPPAAPEGNQTRGNGQAPDNQTSGQTAGQQGGGNQSQTGGP